MILSSSVSCDADWINLEFQFKIFARRWKSTYVFSEPMKPNFSPDHPNQRYHHFWQMVLETLFGAIQPFGCSTSCGKIRFLPSSQMSLFSCECNYTLFCCLKAKVMMYSQIRWLGPLWKSQAQILHVPNIYSCAFLPESSVQFSTRQVAQQQPRYCRSLSASAKTEPMVLGAILLVGPCRFIWHPFIDAYVKFHSSFSVQLHHVPESFSRVLQLCTWLAETYGKLEMVSGVGSLQLIPHDGDGECLGSTRWRNCSAHCSKEFTFHFYILVSPYKATKTVVSTHFTITPSKASIEGRAKSESAAIGVCCPHSSSCGDN